MDFAGTLADLQQSASRTADYTARRAATLRALAPKLGETVLDVGCGSGLFARDVAALVGSSGKVWGIDLSDDQLDAARVNCAQVANVELCIGNALALPYPATLLDAVASIQVLEYVSDVSAALAEMHRVLKPGGRIVNFATIWGSIYWHTPQPTLTERMRTAWDAHAPHPNLPASLRALLVEAGFPTVSQWPVALLNCNYGPSAFSYWLAQIMAAFAVEREVVTPVEGKEWLKQLAQMDEHNQYLFSSLAVVTSGVKAR